MNAVERMRMDGMESAKHRYAASGLRFKIDAYASALLRPDASLGAAPKV
jgi:hypothetical protein